MDWRKFFRINTDYIVPIHNFEDAKGLDLEEMYQAFKARFLDELNPDVGSVVSHSDFAVEESEG